MKKLSIITAILLCSTSVHAQLGWLVTGYILGSDSGSKVVVNPGVSSVGSGNEIFISKYISRVKDPMQLHFTGRCEPLGGQTLDEFFKVELTRDNQLKVKPSKMQDWVLLRVTESLVHPENLSICLEFVYTKKDNIK